MVPLMLSDCDAHLLTTRSISYEKTNGYYRVYDRTTKSKYVYLHRLITGAKKGDTVDHIDRNKHNNRRDNLRIVSNCLNSYNRDVKSKHGRGIYFDAYGNRFRACISFKNKTLKLGSFKDINAAKLAYNKKAKEMYGEDAFQHIIEPLCE